MAMAYNTLVAIGGSEIRMIGEKIRDLSFYCLRKRLRAPCLRISVSWSSKAPG